MTVAFVEIDHIDRVFDLPDGGQYIALKNIELKIKEGEFVSLIGHSGCGKSTLLNIIAGLDRATIGGVTLEGREVRDPGPDRMVVFQNYSLLPWLNVRENIALAVDEVYIDKPKGERQSIIEHHINLVGLTNAARKLPHELSGGMKQRVSIARALAIRPKLLLLDEPFGALDALTRGGLQEQLMKICNENNLTSVMVTHDVDEALLLSDRIVMLTNGPEAHIGQILEVNIPRPRQRMEVVNHPDYYNLRNQVIYFLNQQKQAKKRKAQHSQPKAIASSMVARGIALPNTLEKLNLEIGFLPLTDAAPLIVAKEKGFFAQFGLGEVTLNRETSWKEITQGVATGKLDAAQMVAGMPLALTLGGGGKTPIPVVNALNLSRNANAITLSKRLYDQGVRNLANLKAAINNLDQVFTLGIVHPTSMQNIMLRYWLASGGIDPDIDVKLTVIPPTQMVSQLKAGTIDGFCAGEPWSHLAVHENVGFVVATALEIWSGQPKTVLGVREDWAQKYPDTYLALVKALLAACEYCDDLRNREEILELICRPQYLDMNPALVRPGFTDSYDRGDGSEPQEMNAYNRFYVNKTNYPNRTELLWMMTQMARWGLVTFPKNWVEVIERVCRTDVFGAAARDLGLLDIGEDHPVHLFDGKVFNPSEPIEYLNSFEIKRRISIEEVSL